VSNEGGGVVIAGAADVKDNGSKGEPRSDVVAIFAIEAEAISVDTVVGAVNHGP